MKSLHAYVLTCASQESSVPLKREPLRTEPSCGIKSVLSFSVSLCDPVVMSPVSLGVTKTVIFSKELFHD